MDNIVILFGGPGGEAEVSKLTAKSVEKAIIELEIPYSMLEFNLNTWVNDLTVLKPTFVFIAMHGSPGEDGTVQTELEKLNLPYNGSDARSSALAINKSEAKKLFLKAGVGVAKEYLFENANQIPFNPLNSNIQTPAVFKPNTGGSSVGIEVIMDEDQWSEAIHRIKKSQKIQTESILAEEFIPGRELTIPVLNDEALGVMEIISDVHEFYDYSAKYDVGGSQHIYPAPIATEVIQEAEKLALKAHKSLGCSGVSRVDFRYDEEKKRLAVLEVNTLPGMTSTSLVPEVAKHNGISFSSLISWIIEDGKCKQKVKN